MIDSALYHRLAPVARRFQLRRLFLSLATIWTTATVIGLVLWSMKSTGTFHSSLTLPVLLIATFVASMTGFWFALRGDEEFEKTAHDIEGRYPELNSALITAVEQQPPVAHGTLGFLQQEVVRKAVYHGYQHSWTKVVPQWQMLILPLLAAAGLLAFMISVVGQFMTPTPAVAGITASDSGAPALFALKSGFKIEPGDIEIERFTSLMVLARFANDQVPANAELVFWNDQQEETRQSMAKSLDDPVFGTRINSVREPLQYVVRFDGQESDRYKVSVFEFPKLKRADAQLDFPEYTGRESKLAQDVRRVSGVKGTRVTWMLTLNKPVKSGRLLGKDGQQFELAEDPVEPNRYLAEMTLNASAKFELQLTDNQDRENKSPPTLSVQVVGNQPADIKQLAPASDVEVSPVEELSLAATFWDDFGVERAGVTYSMVGKEAKEIELATSIEAKTRQESKHILAFEELDAKPDELLTFYFWAEDRASDGRLRRSLGDIHLVTVRSFESIFRQGQQPGGGQQAGGQQGGQGQQAGMELVELQREIVYAIWNLQRREIFDQVTKRFVDDVQIISESQASGISQLEQMAENLPDPSMQLIVEAIRGHQQTTIEHLELAGANEDVMPLSDALLSAQSAYQALLQLRSIESDVVQNQQQQQGGGGGGGRQRQQMQQLQLENDENRYESEQTASEREETTEERENRQVLSRLRELARRQNDLNKRIKELQSALEEAETPEEREEIEEQLKRLRDEQQQILRDSEELQERMERPENQGQMSEQAEKLEQARENARQSSEALEEGDATRAAAKGTRALRDMEELRDEFQNRSSGQFDQQMQQMRNEARDIEKEQQRIAEEMDQLDDQSEKQQQRSLTDAKPETGLEEKLERQQSRVESLREEMRETIEEAEDYEPILAERLYDTYRQSQQESPEEALDSTRRSLRQGFVDDAQKEQRRAARNIQELREGIDEAAEAVLGDETEALRRANRELQRLSNVLEDEFDRANPDEQRDQREGQESQDGKNIDEGAGDDSAQEPRDGSGQPRDEESESKSGAESNDDQQGRGGRGQQENDQQTEQPSGQGQQPGEGRQPGDGQQPEDQSEQDGRGGQGARNNQNPQPRNNRDGQPSLREQNQQDQRGALGADPEINYDAETWSDPITGDDFVQWSDRMRDVEEMVADPELRAEAARIRENARSIRREVKRHSKEPNWDLVRLKVIEPLVLLQDKVHEELLRRSGSKSLVPVDRDPVPAEFENAVQKYFEQLGRGQ